MSSLLDLRSLQIRANPATVFERSVGHENVILKSVLENIERKLLALPLFNLDHIDIPDIRVPSKVEFGLQMDSFADYWNIRPVVSEFKK